MFLSRLTTVLCTWLNICLHEDVRLTEPATATTPTVAAKAIAKFGNGRSSNLTIPEMMRSQPSVQFTSPENIAEVLRTWSETGNIMMPSALSSDPYGIAVTHAQAVPIDHNRMAMYIDPTQGRDLASVQPIDWEAFEQQRRDLEQQLMYGTGIPQTTLSQSQPLTQSNDGSTGQVRAATSTGTSNARVGGQIEW